MHPADYHVHTEASSDSKVAMAEYCERAVALGLREIAFTDHYDIEPDDEEASVVDFAKAREAVDALNGRYNSRLKVKLGVEISYQKEFHDEIVRIASAPELDFAIGSVHYIDRGLIHLPEYWRERIHLAPDARAVYLPYFAELKRTVESGLFDVVGHFDYLKKYVPPEFGPFDPGQFKDEIAEILEIAVARGLAVEVNTSGIRRPTKEPYPDPEILKLYYELGGRKVTVGSDSHRIEHLCADFDEAYGIMKDIGFTEVVLFEREGESSAPIP